MGEGFYFNSLPDEWILSGLSMESFLICVCVISSLFLLVKLIPSSDLKVGLFPSIVSYIDVKFVECVASAPQHLFETFGEIPGFRVTNPQVKVLKFQ